MRVIIAGPRDLVPDYEDIKKAIQESGFKPRMIISGGADGVDRMGLNYARMTGTQPIVMEALWDQHGKSAGPRRNAKMAEVADALIVIRRKGEHTAGTNNMLKEAEMADISVYIKEI